MASAVNSIVNHIEQYQYQQALRLLENEWLHNPPKNSPRQLRLKAANSISFPGADIKASQVINKNTIVLEANFMGLYGVDSPLPHYINNMTLRDTAAALRLRTWMDVIHQQVYRLFYQAWKQYRVYVQLQKQTHWYYRYLQAISGGVLEDSDKQEFALAALLGAKQRTRDALQNGLQHLLGGIETKVCQEVASYRNIDNPFCLGKSELIIGDNTLLGQKILSLQHKIRILIGPINKKIAKTLWPKTAKALQLHHFIKRFLKSNLNYEVVLKVKTDDVTLMQLGKNDHFIGRSIWLGQPSEKITQMRVTI